jgi:hypothetical protein
MYFLSTMSLENSPNLWLCIFNYFQPYHDMIVYKHLVNNYSWDAWIVVDDLAWLVQIFLCVVFVYKWVFSPIYQYLFVCPKNKWTKEDLHLSRIRTRLTPISCTSIMELHDHSSTNNPELRSQSDPRVFPQPLHILLVKWHWSF